MSPATPPQPPPPWSPQPWSPQPHVAPPPGRPGQARGPRSNPLGLLLLLPAVVALGIGYGWPTLTTVWASFHEGTLFRSGGGDRTTSNYNRVFDLLFTSSSTEQVLGPGAQGYLAALGLAVVPLALLVVVAPLLAWAINGAPGALRRGARLALTLPLVAVAPTALAVGWAQDRADFAGNAAMAASLRSAVWLTLCGALLAAGTMLFLAAMQEPRAASPAGSAPGWLPSRRALAAAGGVAVVIALATVALALQSFTYPVNFPAGIPPRTAPMEEIYRVGFAQGELGLASAMSVVLLVPVMLLGIAAALVMIFSRMRIEVASARERTATGGQRRLLAGLIAGVGVALVLGFWLYQVWPWLSRLGRLGPIEGSAAASVVIHTWLPPLISAGIGVGLAALAGYGIGAMRPMGRWSELLLLPFAPWLFIGVGPLAITKYETAAFGLLPRVDTVLGYIPPIWLTIPALFVFTLLFRGLTGQRAAAAATGPDPGVRAQLLPALPMLAIVGGATWMVQSQSLLWGLLISRTEFTGPVWALRMVGFGPGRDDAGFGLVYPIPMLLLFLVGAGVLQIMYLDRVAIRVGRTG